MQRLISCFGLCTGVAANDAQFGDGVEHNDIEGVGVTSSMIFLTQSSRSSSFASISFSWSVSSFSPSSSLNVRSSEEAHGARKPPINEGMPDSKSVVASVLSPVVWMK